MPPSSRGRAVGLKPSGRAGRRGGGAGSGVGACGSRRLSLPLAIGVLVLTVPLWLMWRMRQRPETAVKTRLGHFTMPAGGGRGGLGDGERGRLSRLHKNVDTDVIPPALGEKGPEWAGSDPGVGDGDTSGEVEGGGGVEGGDAEDGDPVRSSGDWGSDDSEGGPGSPGFPLGEDDIHVVFSTDCTRYQSWQAVVLFHSAILSGHIGPITQLVSGCSSEDKQEMMRKHKIAKHSHKHRQFFSPSFSINHPETGEPYPYLNKPNAMRLWLNETDVRETIVALIDPDFIFLKPLTTWLSPTETQVRGDGLSMEGLKLENGAWVRKGYPAGQRFSLPNWTHWDRSKICPKDSVCATATTSVAKRYYDLIPPYLAHRDDWRALLPEWVDQAPKVYDTYPSLLAEQTAYATAAATLDLKHYRINNLAVENEKVDYELWDAIDHNVENVCDIGIEPGDGASVDLRSFVRMPTFIHYCHMYRVGQWLFNKRRYRKESGYDQLACDTPLLEPPPLDIQTNDFKMHPGARYEGITPRTAKRNAFVLCVATRFVNSALSRYKGKICAEGTANLQQILRIV